MPGYVYKLAHKCKDLELDVLSTPVSQRRKTSASEGQPKKPDDAALNRAHWH